MINKSSLVKKFYKPRDIKLLLGCSLSTVQNMTKDGRLVDVRTDKNRRMITRESLLNYLDSLGLLIEDDNRHDVIYARVSTHKQKEKGDLDRQVQSLTQFAIDKNPKSLQIITDVASGLNDNRKGLNKLISQIQENKVDRVFVSYKDRLTRFGFNYLKSMADFHNTQIIIIANQTECKSISEELAEDIVALIHSFSGKLYGLRHMIKERIEHE